MIEHINIYNINLQLGDEEVLFSDVIRKFNDRINDMSEEEIFEYFSKNTALISMLVKPVSEKIDTILKLLDL